MCEYYLGLDTSNYKTSVAVTDIFGNVIFQRSELLNVRQGEKGLRQSDAFFQHSNRLPEFTESLFREIMPGYIKAIGVSTRPRRIEGSYMPCFLAGVNTARQLAAVLNVPLHNFSHQEGHAAAILEMNDSLSINDSCLFFHLSGGTTEFLLCKKDNEGYSMNIVGGTKDISIGQLLDRIGVYMKFPFPAGKYMDQIALNSIPYKNKLPKIKLDSYKFNLSGLENSIIRYNESPDVNFNSIIAELFVDISELLYTSANELAEKYKVSKIYMAGGVASSSAIRNNIDILNKYNNDNIIIFADSALCGDNAVGISLLTSRFYR